ncbi:DUF6884 domain-containing protein [Halorientalis halophila]|uniref:DUF6884 domain-containing protein n=1 Tax=Halorientalis halophila TaxID=3108499 RepID=UPI00300B5330
MASLLVQSCSATKEPVDTPVPALDLYDGYFFRIIKKALRADRFQPGLDIIIISAEHGIVEPDDKIEYYDRKMDTNRANELNDELVSDLSKKVKENEYDKVWINLGNDYLPAVDGLEAAVDVPVHYIEGSGIGMKGKRLKHLVSSSRSVPAHGD